MKNISIKKNTFTIVSSPSNQYKNYYSDNIWVDFQLIDNSISKYEINRIFPIIINNKKEKGKRARENSTVHGKKIENFETSLIKQSKKNSIVKMKSKIFERILDFFLGILK